MLRDIDFHGSSRKLYPTLGDAGIQGAIGQKGERGNLLRLGLGLGLGLWLGLGCTYYYCKQKLTC